MLVPVHRLKVAGAEAQPGLEEVAAGAAELQAVAVGGLAAFAEVPFLDAVGAEGLSAAAEAVEHGPEPRDQQQPTGDGREAGIEGRVQLTQISRDAAER